VIATQTIIPISKQLEQVPARLHCKQCGASQGIRIADVNGYIMERNWPTCCHAAMSVFVYPTPQAAERGKPVWQTTPSAP